MKRRNRKKNLTPNSLRPDRTEVKRSRMIAVNGATLLGVWAAGVALLYFGSQSRHVGLAEGQRAPYTLVSRVEFECDNLTSTELQKRQAADAVVPIFSIQMKSLQSSWRIMDKLAGWVVAQRGEKNDDLEQADEAEWPDRAEPDHDAQGDRQKLKLDEVAQLLDLGVPGKDLVALFPAGQEMEALDALKDCLQQVYLSGVVTESNRAGAFQGAASAGIIDVLRKSDEGRTEYQQVELAGLHTEDEALAAFAELAGERLGAFGVTPTREVLEALGTPALQANLEYMRRQTEDRRIKAEQGVVPVRMTVRPGETLMEEGEEVTDQILEKLEAHNRRVAELESPWDRRIKVLANSALLLLVLALCAAWLYGTQPRAYSKPRRKLFLTLLGLLALGLAGGGLFVATDLHWLPSWLVTFVVPVVLPAALAALIVAPRYTLVIGLWSGVSASLLFGQHFEIIVLGLGGSTLIALLLRKVRKRSQVMRAGFALGLFNMVLALVVAAKAQHDLIPFLIMLVTAFAVGQVTMLVALLLLPVMEWLSGHTSNLTLLELTDMGHPLLQRLALEAPGTYHHSLMVGALGQTAADRIGANGLLVRVCANFHDVGKLSKPEYFTENQQGGDNPHDQLAPSMSALVIQSHVKEGLTLARRYKLPRSICEGIATHHGTQLTSFFYLLAKRALQESGETEDAGLEASYRYEGPRPWTRELAVLMLADTVEAASRSITKPTPNRIEEMVDKLIRDKVLDGQLDFCPLTLEDLHMIRDSFVFSLSNILYGRSPYPREDQSVQSAAGLAGAAGGVQAAGAEAGAASVSD